METLEWKEILIENYYNLKNENRSENDRLNSIK